MRPVGVQQSRVWLHSLFICNSLYLCLILRMANTFSQVYLHIVFAVKNSNSRIPATYLPRVHAYIGGVLRQHGHIPYSVGGIDNHVHILVGYNINQPVPDMVRDVKSSTSRFISESHIIPFKFEWQTGYGCFSYSPSHVENVKRYIENQHQHHKSVSLEDEIRNILERYGVEYDERYLIRDCE